MDKITELAMFLAWVQDNYTEAGDDEYKKVEDFDGETYTRQEIVKEFLQEVGEPS